MIKLMIVDDEFYIREGLKKSDLWSNLAIDLAGEAADGAEAWKLYQTVKPDIILLDINIPEMNGIELARAIRRDDEDVQIIFLTGYDEYQLIKEAITLQASDYLLKPIVREDLHKAMQRAIDRVKKWESRNRFLDHLQRQVIDYSKVAHEQWLLDLIQQRRPLKECLDRLSPFGIHFDAASYYAVLCSDNDDFQSLMDQASARDRQLYQYAYRKLAEETMESYEDVYTLSVTPSKIILLISSRAEEESYLIDIAKRLRSVFAEYLKMSVSIGISTPVQGAEHIYKAYLEASSATEYKTLIGIGQIIPYQSINVTISQNNHLLNKELYLLSELRAGNVVNVLSLLQEWSVELRTMAWNDVKLVSCQLVLFVMRLFKEVGLNNKQLIYVNPLVDLANCRTIDELIRFLSAYFTEVGRVTRESKEIPSHKMIEQAKEWIRKHLSEDLSLINLANFLNMSPKYLSSRFKQATGETFAEFSTQLRFERAKELLADSTLKILDVANKVGFTDTNYFSMAFKKYVGITPTEYRKRFL